MGTTAEKLTYLNGTKRLLRRRLNSLGAEITLETKFRDYLLWLDRFYDAASSSVEFEILGETEQRAVNSSANILPLYDDEIVTDGVTVTVSDGGKITINGTATRNMWIKLTNGIEVIYEDPFSNDGHSYYDTYGWLSDEVLSYNPSETKYLQFAHGTGTAPTGASNPSPYTACGMYCVIHTDSSIQPDWTFSDYEDLINRDNVYNDKDVIQTRKATNLNKVNCVFLAINQGLTINEYFYFQICDAHETVWTPNYDALAPSPDNPKRIINKTGEITYTASDGTEFPVWLGGIDYSIELCGNPNPNGKPDRIYYKNGLFWLEKNVETSLLEGKSEEGWYYKSQYDIYRGSNFDNSDYPESFNSVYALSNYFKNVPNPNIVDYSTADANLKNGEFAVLPQSSTLYLRYSGLDDGTSIDTAENFKNWISTHNVALQYDMEEGAYDPILISKEEYPTLYNQLQAIVDYETKLKIEEKIF